MTTLKEITAGSKVTRTGDTYDLLKLTKGNQYIVQDITPMDLRLSGVSGTWARGIFPTNQASHSS